MNAVQEVPLIFLRVLANPDGAPAALLADIGEGDAAALIPFVSAEEFAGLATRIACMVTGEFSPEVVEALAAAGWKSIVAGTVCRADEQLKREFLPPAAAFVDGDWYMAAPAKGQAAQAASRVLALQLVQLVAADADTHEIEAVLRQDATLSYHLLRLVNSLGMGVGRTVNSFSQAILILGRQQLRRWLNLMLFAARQGDVRSSMLMARVAVRARALELLARSRGLDKTAQEQAFMTGMFSLLGVLFGMPLAEVLAPLAIGEPVRRALLERGGDLGELLAVVESAERGHLRETASLLARMQLPSAEFNAAILDANSWMLTAVRDNQGKAHG